MRVVQIAEMTSAQQIEFRNYIAKEGGLQYIAVYLAVDPTMEPFLKHEYVNLGSRKYYEPMGYIDTRAVREVLRLSPDLTIIGDYVCPAMQWAMYGLGVRRMAWVVWAERPGMLRGIHRKVGRHVLQRPIARLSAGVFAIGSLAVREYLRIVRGRVPVVELPYFIDVDRYRTVRRVECGGEDRIRFLFVGKLIRRKGVDILIRAFRQVIQVAPGCVLTVVGDGPERGALEEMVGSDLRGSVRFVGRKDWSELPEWYRQHDVLVFPSRHDGWGLPVYEGLASAMPVIGTERVGAVEDLVKDGQTGYRVRHESVDALRDAMIRMVRCPEEVRNMGERGRRLMGRYTLREGVTRLRKAVEDVLERRAEMGAEGRTEG